MSTLQGGLIYSPASLQYRISTPSELMRSSQLVGWSSVLLEIHRVDPSSEVFEHGATPDQTIVVQTKGTQELESFRSGEWRRTVYRPGTVGMTPPSSVARLRRRLKRHATAFEKVNLYVPQGFFLEAADHYRRSGHSCCTTPLRALGFNDPLVAQTVFSLVNAMDVGAPDLYAQCAAQWLATHLLSAHSSWLKTQDRRHPGIMSDKRLARVVEYMSANFAQSLALDNLAAEAAVSKFHFARLFRDRTGTTPHEYLTQLRMDAARSMLHTTNLQVDEIAINCGFARASHFVTVFKKRYGVSPNLFRKNYG